MTNSTKTYSIDLNNLSLIDGDYIKSDDWIDMIYDRGSFSIEGQYMTFISNGLEVVADYELSVSGYVSHDPGDYWTPPYTDVDITDFEVDLKSLHIEDLYVDFSKELKVLIEVEIKKHL